VLVEEKAWMVRLRPTMTGLISRASPEAVILTRSLTSLNAQRRAEEAEGLVRWLRPAFQATEEGRRVATQTALAMKGTAFADAILWPCGDTAKQYIVLHGALARIIAPTTAGNLARHVTGAPRAAKIGDVLRVLTALGQARDAENGTYAA
jgi:hypothetical protein